MARMILIIKEKFLNWLRIRSLDRLRKYALAYIKLLDMHMKENHTPRHTRRQFWRELVSKGRFYSGPDRTPANKTKKEVVHV